MDKLRVHVANGMRTEKITITRSKKQVVITTENKAVARRITEMVVGLFQDGEPVIGFKDD